MSALLEDDLLCKYEIGCLIVTGVFQCYYRQIPYRLNSTPEISNEQAPHCEHTLFVASYAKECDVIDFLIFWF